MTDEQPVKPKPGELQMAPPRRAMPPQHLSDLTSSERRAKAEELGLKGFRADQLSRQWFGRLNEIGRAHV